MSSHTTANASPAAEQSCRIRSCSEVPHHGRGGVLQQEDDGEHAQGQHDLHEYERVPAAHETKELGGDDRNRTELELGMRAIEMKPGGADESTGMAEQQSGGIVEVVPRGCVLDATRAPATSTTHSEVHVPRVDLAGARGRPASRGCTGAIVTR